MAGKILNLIIVGPQGSGKGTQAALLKDKFHLAYIGSGDALREIAKQDSDLGKKVRQRIQSGVLVEDEIVAEVIAEKLKEIPARQGIILDGYPRNLGQYETLRNFLAKSGRSDYRVLDLELSEDIAIQRLGNRYTCESCGEIYTGPQNGSCKKCGGKLSQREDDKPEAIALRLRQFTAQTRPMIEAMARDGRLLKIDGAPPIPEVNQAILAGLNF